MQFILTEDEYASLTPVSELRNRNDAIAAMREMIVGKECIHAKVPRADRFWSCGECPLSDIGGREGEQRPSHAVSGAMCDLDREYSQ